MLKPQVSKIRKQYLVRLVCRCLILLGAVALYFTDFQTHDILYGFAFFRKFSLLHLLWIIWMLDMISQLVDEDSELISVYYGEDTSEEDAQALGEYLEETYGDCDVEVHFGGQPIYYYVVSVE